VWLQVREVWVAHSRLTIRGRRLVVTHVAEKWRVTAPLSTLFGTKTFYSARPLQSWLFQTEQQAVRWFLTSRHLWRLDLYCRAPQLCTPIRHVRCLVRRGLNQTQPRSRGAANRRVTHLFCHSGTVFHQGHQAASVFELTRWAGRAPVAFSLSNVLFGRRHPARYPGEAIRRKGLKRIGTTPRRGHQAQRYRCTICVYSVRVAVPLHRMSVEHHHRWHIWYTHTHKTHTTSTLTAHTFESPVLRSCLTGRREA